MRISVDGSHIHNNKVAFSNLSGIVWTGPEGTFLKGPCKRTQQVQTTPNNVGCCWPTMLRPFTWD